jgi:ferrochelatase
MTVPPHTCVITVNTGTPDSPSPHDVRRYLRSFLGDKKVIDLPWLFRKILVNMIIAPFRGSKSAKLYSTIWTDKGSPLLVNSRNFNNSLQTNLGDGYKVIMAMRYGNPSIDAAIKTAVGAKINKLIIMPVFPQYADSTTGSIIAETENVIKKNHLKVETRIIGPFFQDTGFIKAFSEKIGKYRPEEYEHIVFSFHGLPVSQTEKMHPGKTCVELNCTEEYTDRNSKCYNASCYATARLLAGACGISKKRYTVSFQSRLGMKWLKPYTDMVLKEKALVGAKKVLLVSPSFVSDCLETIYELGIEYKRQFTENGGKELTLVESLNDDSSWVNAAAEIIRQNS